MNKDGIMQKEGVVGGQYPLFCGTCLYKQQLLIHYFVPFITTMNANTVRLVFGIGWILGGKGNFLCFVWIYVAHECHKVDA